MKSYALRLRKQIPEEHPTVVGVSFGGMLAAEMAKEDQEMNVIIIASNKSSAEFPYYLRVGKYFPLYKWLPEKLIKNRRLVNWILGVKEMSKKNCWQNIVSRYRSLFSEMGY